MAERNVKAREDSSVEPEQRVSVSGLIIPDEQLSASRSVQLAEVPSRWLDRLLALSIDLPVTQGEDAVIQSFVEGLSLVFPSHAVGVVVPSTTGSKAFRSAEPERDTRESQSFPASAPQPTTTTLFRQLQVERLVRAPGVTDATLHIASDDPALLEEASPVVQVAHRALFVLEGARRQARAAEEVACLRRDLEEREMMLVQADKLASLGQLAAGMVHEINNPLTSITAYVDLLTKHAAARNDEEDLERLRRISESAQRMIRLSRDVVSYARPSGGVAQPVVISSVIEQALVFCEHLVTDAGVLIVKQFGAGVLPVRGRPDQLAQVFVNLVTNACHAMPTREARLFVSTELVSGETRVRVIVGDNGHGIPESMRERVFQPFFTTKDEHHGTGLGLSIVRSIVEGHDGEIRVESDATGTRFVILLPVAAAR